MRMITWNGLLWSVLACCLLLSGAFAADLPSAARQEIRWLKQHVPGFRTVRFRRSPGRVEVPSGSSFTVEDLRGLPLDENPPVLGKPAGDYPRQHSDTHPPGEAPYVARDIAPFRFEHFDCEFNYGGWHNFEMVDYASTHGFNIIFPYIRSWEKHRELLQHLPEGTEYLSWGGGVKWKDVLPDRKIPGKRFDRFAELSEEVDMVRRAVEAGSLSKPDWQTYKMIDIEHGPLDPATLREQEWYPADATEARRQAFERRYYHGFALTYLLPVRVARRQGWEHISIYGWQPSPRTWHGLRTDEIFQRTAWRWERYGRDIYEEIDLLNPSVYCFYWTPRNVAYTLAIIDMNMRRIVPMPRQKPIRPYYWTLLHGGGTGWRWWKNQPLPNEEARAMTAMGFFTGFDGFVTWNWSGTGNHHRPGPIEKDADLMLADGFALTPTGGGKEHRFRRYDVLHVTAEVEEEMVTFQPIMPGEKDRGVGEDRPAYTMKREELGQHLRAKSDPVSAVIEGMALVKPVEYILRHGEAKIDVPAQRQWQEKLPVIRRVKLGPYHLVVTYDPGVVHGGQPRRIELEDFDGQKGLSVSLPADEKTRVFVLEE